MMCDRVVMQCGKPQPWQDLRDVPLTVLLPACLYQGEVKFSLGE